MVNKSISNCPQCLHQNSIDVSKCSLCDWPLISQELDETRMPEAHGVDPNMTTAPNTASSESIDPDLTQAPMANNPATGQNSTSPGLSIAEKQTFHLAGDLAHFEIHEILGQGGMGAVYHAKDRTLHRDVAIKMLRPMMASGQFNTEALLDEARMASKLNHPNIVTIYDVARSKDSSYIVMEWVDGQALDELIPPEGLELVKALEYACQIADGLTNAHQKYIIHRDIKPQNIMLSSQNTIKILDFGIAGYINNDYVDDVDNGTLESSETSVGTPNYMSPEQSQGLNLDQRSDIFSFGIVLYQMLCGKRPFIGKTRSALKQAICNDDYIPIEQHKPELPTNIVQLLEKMLASKKDERWQSSAELAQALHDIHNELTYKKNWWQRRGWISKAAIILPFVLALGWSSKEILFPASTQQLIERQLQEATKIAILPFDNISGDPLLQLFSDGLAVNLGSDLSAIASHQGNTWIVPSTEISRMKDQSPKKVADKYGVNLILTGSIQHMGSTRLLVLNLLNGSDGQQLKTVEVSINADNLFQGHAKVRKQALDLLDWSIPKELKTKFNAQRPQLDGAYKAYVQGRGYLYRYDQSGNLDKSLNAFQKAIEIDNSYENAFVGLAEAKLIKFFKTKNNTWLDTMASTISKLKVLNPENSQVKYLYAEIAMQKGDYQNAITLFQESIQINKNHIKSLIGLANVYNKNGNIVKAEQIYKNTIQHFPNNWRVISDFGVFYYQNGKYNEALIQFKHLSQMSPNNDIVVRNMAGIYYSMGDVENAIYYTKQAIKLKPSGKAYTNLGTMYFSIKKYKESILAFEKAVELNDTDYINWGNLADAYKLTKNIKSIICYNNAISRATNILKSNSKNNITIADLSYYLANINNQEKAVFFASQIGINNSGLANYIVATAYDHMGMTDKTLLHLGISLDKNYSLEDILTTPLLKHVRNDKRFKELTSIKLKLPEK